ncbi:major facilitator superfamily domain-containing protein [Leptodontidium sp. MPI-SDFR-AT-0119]|nr:major facilitator superfamily domain-containing protein [Leptodontidium sp. MPI-SDFR-AT-0119]
MLISTSDSSKRTESGFEIPDVEKGLPVSEEQHREQTLERKDSNVVDWDGPLDPEIPLNWTGRKKWTNILMVAVLTLLTPFASSMFAPSAVEVMHEMDVTNPDLGSFAVSIYLLGYAFGPLIIAPLSEMYGRLIMYHSCTILFLLTTLGVAKSSSMPMLIGFRLLTGLCGACPLTLGPSTVSDLFKQEYRGKVMAMWTLPVLLGPSVGPVAGSYISAALGWRWDFWFLMIATGVVFVPAILLLRETYEPVLLARKVHRLRKETNNEKLVPARHSNKTPTEIFWISIVRPLRMLCLSPITLGLSVLTATAYGILYLLFTTVTPMFKSRYGMDKNVGLVYLGFGLGQFIGIIVLSKVSDWLVLRMAKGREMKPEYRLPPLVPGAACIPIGLLIFGWTAEYNVHWIAPVIGTVVIGFGMIATFMPVGVYLVDAFTIYAASATAANTVLRSLGGAVLPLCGPKLYAALGTGWGSTLLAAMALVMMPMIWYAMKFGEGARARSKSRF